MARVNKNEEKNKKKSKLPSKKAYLILMIVMGLVSIGFFAMIAVVNAFPKSMIIGFILFMVIMLVLTGFLFSRDKKWMRIVGIVVAALYIIVYGFGIYYLGSTYATLNKVSVDPQKASVAPSDINITDESFNVYISGIDQWEGEKGEDLERSDVNMIVTVCPKTKKILLTSIPRDTYVPLHRNGEMDKLTHTGVYGVDETLNTIKDYTGLTMDYYVKMNFTAVYEMIDAIGGVDVYSTKTFVPTKRPWYTVKKGWNHMNGGEALAFARERAAFDGEDAQRVENQQAVVKAIIKKMTSSTTLMLHYGDILKAGGNNMETNMPVEDMQDLIKMQLADLGEWDIETQKLTGEYKMDYVASLTQEEKFLVYKVEDSTLQAAVDKIKKVMNPSASEIAAATAKRQSNSIKNIFKALFGGKDK